MVLTKTPICNFGEKTKSFELKGTDGQLHKLEDHISKNGLLIMFILVTLTLKIFSIFFLRFFLFALEGTLKTILLCSDKLVDFSVTKGDKILSYE